MKVQLFLLISVLTLLMAFEGPDRQPSCFWPTPEIATVCAEQASRIRKATVRIVLYSPDGVACALECEGYESHATLVGDCRVLTHRHYALIGEDGALDNVALIALYDVDGHLLVTVDPATVRVDAYAGEAQMLAFGPDSEGCLLERLGLEPVITIVPTRQQLATGTELATVYWDEAGERSVIVWVRVQRVSTYRGVRIVQINGYLPPGSSGAGLFWYDRHIGNTWFRAVSNSGSAPRRYSAGALNTQALLAPTAVTANAQ